MRAALLPLLAAALAAPAAGQYRAWEATSRDAATTAAARSALYSDLTGLVAFKSVSAKGPAPDWTDETEGGPATVREAAWWCFNRLEALGLENAAVMETGEVGRDAPIVYADWLHAGPGEPTVLVYAHYDVQPVEPLDKWQSDPFKLTEFDHPTDGPSLRGRGAADDKGGLLVALHGLAAVATAAGQGGARFPVNIRVMLEGQEEIGSPHLRPFLEKYAYTLACDYVLSADGDMVAPGVASLTLGYRGAVALRVTATTASSDLHSGSYGGSVANAAGVMAGLVAGLHTAGGAVAAPGFYDGLPPAPLRAAEAAQLAAVPFDEAADLARVGARGGWGEPGFGALARRWLRPTAEVVGMWSGWTGDGTKTVLPAVAAATVVARTVPGQDGDAVFQSLRSHLLSSAARGPYAGLADVSVARLGFASEPYSADAGAAVSRAAAEALAAVYGAQPLLVRSGGSIAALPLFRRLLGADTASLAFGHGGNGAHAPNEHMAKRDLERGLEVWATVLFRVRRLHAEAAAAAAAGAGARLQPAAPQPAAAPAPLPPGPAPSPAPEVEVAPAAAAGAGPHDDL